MQLLIVLAAFGASLLTLISGFGLGTLMLPVFALFFPLPMAVGMTAVVHKPRPQAIASSGAVSDTFASHATGHFQCEL